MGHTDELSANMEGYLEVVYSLVQQGHVARVKDIASKLGVSMPSVCAALKTLSSKGLVNYDPYQFITLTEEGQRIASHLARHHQILKDFMVQVLHVPEQIAEENACRIEHAISDNVLGQLVEFLRFMETCPRAGFDWLEGFGYVCSEHRNREDCLQCINAAQNRLVDFYSKKISGRKTQTPKSR